MLSICQNSQHVEQSFSWGLRLGSAASTGRGRISASKEMSLAAGWSRSRKSSSPSQVGRKWSGLENIGRFWKSTRLPVYLLPSFCSRSAVGVNSAQEEEAAFPPPLSSHFRWEEEVAWGIERDLASSPAGAAVLNTASLLCAPTERGPLSLSLPPSPWNQDGGSR